MSHGAAPPNEPKNGNGTILGAVSRFGSQVVGSLAPQFLPLLIVNAFFMAAFVWYVNARAEHTMSVVQQLLTTCLSAAQPRVDTTPLH